MEQKAEADRVTASRFTLCSSSTGEVGNAHHRPGFGGRPGCCCAPKGLGIPRPELSASGSTEQRAQQEAGNEGDKGVGALLARSRLSSRSAGVQRTWRRRVNRLQRRELARRSFRPGQVREACALLAVPQPATSALPPDVDDAAGRHRANRRQRRREHVELRAHILHAEVAVPDAPNGQRRGGRRT